MTDPQSLTTFAPDIEFGVERVHKRPRKQIRIEPYNPVWVDYFEHLSKLITNALGERALQINHVGSTAVPSLDAKEVIDIDVVVADVADEANYGPALEAAGFLLLYRTPGFYNHRLFGYDQPPYYANVHVFGLGCPEVTRHLFFRDWLREHEDDRVKYVKAKIEAAEWAIDTDASVDAYNVKKEDCIRDIFQRIFKAKGLI